MVPRAAIRREEREPRIEQVTADVVDAGDRGGVRQHDHADAGFFGSKPMYER